MMRGKLEQLHCKKREIKISDIYTCDKRRRVAEDKNQPGGSLSLGAAFISHFFMATGSLTALSVAPPAEWTRLAAKEADCGRPVARRTGS